MNNISLAVGLLLLSSSMMAREAVNLRIINGEKADSQSNKWEWILSLRQSGEHICGASLIAPQWALTAAHCITTESDTTVPAPFLSVMSGSYNLNTPEQVVRVKEVIRHPGYNTYSVDNDIALLKLSSPVTSVNPASIDRGDDLYAGELSFVAGWGNMSTTDAVFPEELMEVDLRIIDFSQCSRSYRSDGIDLTANMFCAGYMDGSKDSCQGDSGGPLIVPKNGTYDLAGIVSFGGSEDQMCGAANYPGIYTKVQNYVAWIEGYTGSLKRAVPLEELLKNRGSYTVDGTFGQHDFENVPSAFDWVYQTAEGEMFQLQGRAPSENDLFGWKEVYGITLIPQWKMIYLGSDIDGDGSTKFDWIVVGIHTDAVYKLAGVRDNGTFQYSEKLNIHYVIKNETVRFFE